MKTAKDKMQVVLIILVVLGAFVFSVAGFAGIFGWNSYGKDTSSSEAMHGDQQNTGPGSASTSTSQDTGNSESEPASSGRDTISYVTDEEAKDFLAAFYSTDMFGAKQPKDLLENEDFIGALLQYGMSEEDIQKAINDIQKEYETHAA